MNPDSPITGEPSSQMRYGRFFFLAGLQIVAAVAIFRLAFPATFADELRHPWAILGVGALFGIPLSLFEYLYHRYLLHSAVLPFLSSMHRAHTLHHSLTSVKAPVRAKAPEVMVPVHSDFPVDHEHQTEAMEFPTYALAIFMGIFLVVLGLPTKALFPHSPAILATLLSVTVYYSAYEIWHAILHLPYDQFWKPAMEKRGIGRVVQHTYSFHLMHHWRPTANLAIVGLWGFAAWDYALGTHRRPERLPLHGAQVCYHDAKLKRPAWPIFLLDRWQGGLYRFARRIEKWASTAFSRG